VSQSETQIVSIDDATAYRSDDEIGGPKDRSIVDSLGEPQAGTERAAAWVGGLAAAARSVPACGVATAYLLSLRD